MPTVTKIQGLSELKAKLDSLPAIFVRGILRDGVYAGALVARAAIVAATPIGKRVMRRHGKQTAPGNLRKSVRVRFVRDKSNDTQVDFVVTFSRAGFYAGFVEFGHRIVPRRSRNLPRRTIRARREAATGAVQPHRFVGPTFARVYGQSLDAIVQTMQAGFDRAVDKL